MIIWRSKIKKSASIALFCKDLTLFLISSTACVVPANPIDEWVSQLGQDFHLNIVFT